MARTEWPPYRTVAELIHAHVGRAAVVMGGGPSLTPANIRQAPSDALYISANDHGLRFLADHPKLELRASYVVAVDKIPERLRYDQRYGRERPWNVPMITRKCYGDFRVLHMPAPLTGLVSAWLARLMGCSPIIVIGIDLYSGATYHDQPKAASNGKTISTKEHRQQWRQLSIEHPAMYRALGCHEYVREVLGTYDPAEPVEPPLSAAELARGNPEVRVRIIQPAEIYLRKFSPGTVIDVGVKEAACLINERKAIKA
jgi:hypothetical protein